MAGSPKDMAAMALNNDRDASPSPRSRSASISLQAAATLNAAQRSEPARRSSGSSTSHMHRNSPGGRRRSQVLANLQNDPNAPAPGEMVSDTLHAHGIHGRRTGSPLTVHGISSSHLPHEVPHHTRTPSLGELHQELENEQEFQVNRLLQEIRRLQELVMRQQSGVGDEATGSTTIDLPSAGSTAAPVAHVAGSGPRSPALPHHPHPRSSFEMARADLQRRSRTPSRGASPRLRSTSTGLEAGDAWCLGGRDENAFYQAETQMLVRENQMLRHRIRELERQLGELTGSAGTAAVTHEPVQASGLHRSTSMSDELPEQASASPAVSPSATDAAKHE